MATSGSADLPEPTGREQSALSLELAGDREADGGHGREALSCWGRALEILAAGGRPSEAARVASKMAVAEENLGEAEAAGVHYVQAADLYRIAGDQHRIPICLNNLAMLRQRAGRVEEAAVLLRRALEEASRCHGSVHGETALIATNLGTVLCACGDLLGAEQCHMQALGIREQLFGPAHPEAGLSLGHLGVIHQMRGDPGRARSFYTSALAILAEFPQLHQAERDILSENLAGL
jgi:tetratricopeptide (TPR) repeat protein